MEVQASHTDRWWLTGISTRSLLPVSNRVSRPTTSSISDKKIGQYLTEWSMTEWSMTEWSMTEWSMTEWSMTEWSVCDRLVCGGELVEQFILPLSKKIEPQSRASHHSCTQNSRLPHAR